MHISNLIPIFQLGPTHQQSHVSNNFLYVQEGTAYLIMSDKNPFIIQHMTPEMY